MTFTRGKFKQITGRKKGAKEGEREGNLILSLFLFGGNRRGEVPVGASVCN